MFILWSRNLSFLLCFSSISTQLREFVEGRRSRKGTFARTKSDQSGSIEGPRLSSAISPSSGRTGIQGRSREPVRSIGRNESESRRPYKAQTAAIRPLGSNNAAWTWLFAVSRKYKWCRDAVIAVLPCVQVSLCLSFSLFRVYRCKSIKRTMRRREPLFFLRCLARSVRVSFPAYSPTRGWIINDRFCLQVSNNGYALPTMSRVANNAVSTAYLKPLRGSMKFLTTS